MNKKIIIKQKTKKVLHLWEGNRTVNSPRTGFYSSDARRDIFVESGDYLSLSVSQ